ncbi:hypothetical protein QA649_27910 [Bradyrhizobium sp. CB1717]|uniref:hypothetical protein n=1 Tax=Bradyrhizobium sp. CB1717 TaxID=3039154 RepID=UPI0024B26040|nr:hypothetical protein [Bradyrhizobium sp. CB1717]WFU21914.1 hypothetical protein QA649_27910 [Bradyrhizobium sp. CB1717]
MSVLSDISTGGNRKIVAAQLHWAERPGVGSVAAFGVDVDRIVVETNRKFDNLAAGSGTDVTSAKSAFATLAAAAKTAATNAGKVEVPDAA